jgi:hypothetical protein
MQKPAKKPKPLRESIVQAATIKKYEADGWLVVKIIQTTLNGWPDLQCHRAGVTLFIETKATGKKLSELQKYRHAQLKAQGFTVLTIDNV